MNLDILKKISWSGWLFIFIASDSLLIYKLKTTTGGIRDYYFMWFILNTILFTIILYKKLKK